MLNLTLEQLESITFGQLHGEKAAVPALRHAVIDSRKIQPGDVFFALKGTQVDGHDYVDAAIGAGAAVVVLEKQQSNLNGVQLVVDDSQKAMARIAQYRRRHFTGQVIALTGSAGKTTTKEMLVKILKTAGSTDCTQGNLNNELGVPLTLMNMQPDQDFYVVEMGAAERGDIRYLMQIAEPDITAITNVGDAHIGRFGSQQVIAETKAEIYKHLKAGGKAVVNLDDAYATDWLALLAEKGCELMTFSTGNSDADVDAETIEQINGRMVFEIHYRSSHCYIKLPGAGVHNVANAVCATALALQAGCELEHAVKGLSDFAPVAGRLNILEGNWGGILIDDSYNANPASVKAAIDVLMQQSGQRWLVLGDMAELGSHAESAHQDVGSYAGTHGVENLLVIGDHAASTLKGYSRDGRQFNDHDSLVAFLQQELQPGDAVLVKGSRSSAMEHVVAPLMNKGLE